ncbi:MAG: phosphotransferase [Halobacteriovoraceae bacterium]|nr:phosphotransferase [Halobacteriovoraceae bacterium]
MISHEEFERFISNFPFEEMAIVQLSFDGVNTLHSGVGRIVLQTQRFFMELNEKYASSIKFKLFLITCNYTQSLSEYSASLLNQNRLECASSGGQVYLLSSSFEDQMFGHPKQWEELCHKGAEKCVEIIQDNPYTLILSHDTAYAHIPSKINSLINQGKVDYLYQSFWIPHGLSWFYNGHTPDQLPIWPERHEWELDAFKKALSCNYKIGYISEQTRRLFQSYPFQAPEETLIFFQTGIFLDPYSTSFPQEEIACQLAQRDIPLDKKLIFSIGRATPLKGHDITLEMFRHLNDHISDIYLVILAPQSDHMPEYLDMLKKRIADENLNVLLIDRYDGELAKYIYQWRNTVIVSLLSREDTFPLTVMEARVNPNHSIVLASNQGGMGAQISHRTDGFVCSLEGLESIITSPQSLSETFRNLLNVAIEIIELQEDKRSNIISAGKRLIKEKYDLRNNMLKNLHRLVIENSSLNSINPILKELSTYHEILSQYFSIPEKIFLDKVPGGFVNPPYLVHSLSRSIGLIKSITTSFAKAEEQLKVIQALYSMGFSHLPQLFINALGNRLSLIGKRYYYLVEYLEKDSMEPSFEDILRLTGSFHQYTKTLTPSTLLKNTKLDEYLERYTQFLDLDLSTISSRIFPSGLWREILSLADFFASEKFNQLYSKLPKHLIHGDLNQSNILYSHNKLYLIDWDSIRYDVRLLDLASYFRYGGFDKYICLTKEGELFNDIHQHYGILSGTMTSFERENLHLIVAFSHIEFLVWALLQRREMENIGNDFMKEKLSFYISTYLEQMKIILEILTYEENLYENLLGNSIFASNFSVPGDPYEVDSHQ